MTIWIIEWPVEWSAWKTKLFRLKILLTRRYLGKRLNLIRSSILEKHGSTGIGVKYPYSERSPPLKTGLTLAIFESSGSISFSIDKSNINFKETYSSPKHFSTTLNLYFYSLNIFIQFRNNKKTREKPLGITATRNSITRIGVINTHILVPILKMHYLLGQVLPSWGREAGRVVSPPSPLKFLSMCPFFEEPLKCPF